MTDATVTQPDDTSAAGAVRTDRLRAGLKRRYARERRFRLYGLLAIGVAVGFLLLLLGRIVEQGHTAFYAHSMTVAAPVGLFAAIYLSEYAGPVFRATVKPVLEVLAGVPTVVYGFFAALTVGPAFREFFNGLGAQLVGGPLDGLGQYLMLVQNQMALVAGGVMGIMLIPFVSSLSDDIINAVPQSLRDGSYAMGATKSETVKRVLLPAALPGVAGAMLLAMSRAIGETMIVTMAAGLAARLTLNPLDTVTTVTVQIVTLLTGDQEFDSPKTLAAFGLGLTLFLITLVLNIIAQRIVHTYRQQYD